MKVSKFQIIQYLILLITGIFLCWLFFKNVDLKVAWNEIKERNFSWFYLVIFVSILVYILRTLRWKMLIESNGHKVLFSNLLSALSIGYFVNLIIPRLGEITRCLSIKKNHNIRLTELIGTVIIERTIDIISLFIFLTITLLLQFNHIVLFVKENIIQPFSNLIHSKVNQHNFSFFIIALFLFLGTIIILIYFRKKINQKTPKSILLFLDGLKQGVISISMMKQKSLFILYTILIWAGYYFMTYFWFFVFSDYSFLTWGACLSIVAIGTIGRSVPIQGGGIGAYHFLVAGVVLLYGGTETFGKSLATLIHGGQMFFTFLMGIAGLIIFYFNYWKNKS